MKYLAVDYGQKRTGIAVSDAGGRMAFARKIISMSTRERFWVEFLALAAEEAPQAIVVGLPRQADGSEGLTARQVRNFVKSLQRRLDLPVYFMDEQLSSFEAENMMREQGLKRNKNSAAGRGSMDDVAAARILESFLSQPAEKRVSA